MRQTTVPKVLSSLLGGDVEPGGYCVIAGTTASGKSALSLAIAERVDGVIVNADSVQLFASLPTLTARPDASALARAPHRLYGILDDDERCSAARWLGLAAEAIDAAQPHLAIVTGGTGFYLEALLNGLPDVPATPPALRAMAAARFGALGRERFAAELVARDPSLGDRGPPGDPQRLMRAWEVMELTGRSIRSFEATRTGPALPPFRGGLALVPPAAIANRRIANRLEAMLAAGVLDELRYWRNAVDWRHVALAKADGVVELGRYLDGESSLEAAVEATIIKVRRYAKRQRTWLRNRLQELEPIAAVGDELAPRSGGQAAGSKRG